MITRFQIFTIELILLFVMFTGQVFSQQFTFNKVTPPDGGNFNFVTGIVQDPSGIMWFSTKQGLYKYNGNQLISYQNNPFNPNSLTSNFLESIFADFDGHIWIGTLGSGLNRFDPETENFTHFKHDQDNPASISCDTVTCILRDKQGILWVGTHGGLDKFDEKTNSFSHFRHNENDSTSISNNQVRAIYEDNQGTLWIGTGSPYPDNGGGPNDGGLNRMDKNTSTFIRYYHDVKNNQSLISNKISAIFEDNQGTFWIATAKNGLHKMNREQGTFERLIYDPAHPEKFSGSVSSEEAPIYEHITFIRQDAAENYWFGTTDDGLYYYNQKTEKLVHYKRSSDNSSNFDDNGTWTAFTSRDGILWIGGTTQGNIYRINPLRIEIPQYPTPAGVNGFYEEQNGDFWIGRDDSLIIVDKNKQTIKRFRFDSDPTVNNDNWTQLIKEDKQGNIWSGAATGLNLWDKKREKYVTYSHNPLNNKTISDSRILSFYEEDDKNLWVGTVNGLSHLDRETGIFSNFYFRLDDTTRIGNNVISTILKDKTAKFWIGLENGGGLFIFNRETQKSKKYLKGLSIITLYEDTKGTLWVGSGEGLFYYNPTDDNFIRYNDPGLVSGIPNALSIVEDNRNYLWVSSNIGLIRINPTRNESSKFGKNFGIVGNELYRGSVYKDRSGKLYFGFAKGYYEINPEELFINQKLPEIIISGFRLADQPVVSGNDGPLKQNLSITEEIRLQYSQNVFSFDFAIIDYANPEQNQLIYKLENYDKIWMQSNAENRAYYFNVPPGKYSFRVKGANSYGVWSEKSIDIIILPPWYLTWWAYIIYGILFIVVIFGFDRFQRQRLLGKEKEKNRQRELAHAKEIEKAYTELKTTQTQLIQAEKMASLGELTAGIAHEIQNPLNFVNNFSEVNKELLEEMNEEIEKGNLEEVKLLAKDVIDNEQKINYHGKRADAIVKGMLQHSRTSSGVKEPTDINALADEYLRLAYHGLRAKDKSFNANMKTDFDETIGKINVIPQDLGRVILNLITNAFYAIAPPHHNGNMQNTPVVGNPTVWVSTKKEGNKIFITVRDNGPGIPQIAIDKIFQPFFTTKPSGQGTGLGLSMSYEIVTKGHGGELKVDNKPGEGAIFTIILPV